MSVNIASGMGLGKTYQVIVWCKLMFEMYTSTFNALVICATITQLLDLSRALGAAEIPHICLYDGDVHERTVDSLKTVPMVLTTYVGAYSLLQKAISFSSHVIDEIASCMNMALDSKIWKGQTGSFLYYTQYTILISEPKNYNIMFVFR